jgi:protein TonB
VSKNAAARASNDVQSDVQPMLKSTVKPTEIAIPKDQPSKARDARIKNWDRVAQIIGGDYPSRAAREGIQGTVYVQVVVAIDGRASSCSVKDSSGSKILDDAACNAVERFARFEPALNSYGNRITGTYLQRVSYKLQ